MRRHNFSMLNRFFLVLLFLLLCLTACGPQIVEAPSPSAEPSESSVVEERSFRLLTLNDVYRIEGVEDGVAGGMARVRALREALEGDDLLVLHAGDLLFPSLLSRKYGGQQMIDLLNLLDGDGPAFDERLFATFGNHEFDDDKLDEAHLLDDRVEESRFTWFDTNIVWKAGEDGKPLVEASNMVPSKRLTVGGVEVGLFGVIIDSQHPAYIDEFQDPSETARRLTQELRDQGAEVVIALTHLELEDDLKLLQDLGADGPDLVIGGHEHSRQCYRVSLSGTVTPCVAEPGQEVQSHTSKERLVVKADAEARTMALLEVTLPAADGAAQIRLDYRTLESDAPQNAQSVERVNDWLERFERWYCLEKKKKAMGCLDEVVGHTQVELLGEELEIRRYETNLGNWIAQQALEAYADRGVVAAFVNSGSLRLNQDIPAGPVTVRHIEEIFQYSSRLRILDLRGEVLQQVIDHAVEGWTGSGHWLQIAGFAYRHTPSETSNDGTADRLTLLTPEGPRPVKPDEIVRVVVSEYLAVPRPGSDQDGYTMLTPEMWVDEGPAPKTLRQLVEEGLARAGTEGIAPQVEGRICSTDRKGPCLAIAP